MNPAKFATRLSKQRVLYPTRQFEVRLGLKDMPFAHTYPHQILRENKQATGAGADRVSQGMRCAFGKNVGTAARVKRGQRFISIKCHPKDYLAAKDALRKAGMKVPSSCTTRLVRGC